MLVIVFIINQYQLLFNPIMIYCTTLKRIIRPSLSVERFRYLFA